MTIPSFSRIEISNSRMAEAPEILRNLSDELSEIMRVQKDASSARILSHQAINTASQKLRERKPRGMRK